MTSAHLMDEVLSHHGFHMIRNGVLGHDLPENLGVQCYSSLPDHVALARKHFDDDAILHPRSIVLTHDNSSGSRKVKAFLFHRSGANATWREMPELAVVGLLNDLGVAKEVTFNPSGGKLAATPYAARARRQIVAFGDATAPEAKRQAQPRERP